jgi:NAD-dependent deacetylase
MKPGKHFEGAERAAWFLKNARHAVAFTGAGISTPSGIPDFRSPASGLWGKDDPMRVASLTAFHNHPDIFFNWLRPLARAMRSASPNPAHQALTQLETSNILKAIITQNLDGLHQRSGARIVLELHGSMQTLSCIKCNQIYPMQDYIDTFIDDGALPCCRYCGKLLKPDLILYEEMLPLPTWEMAMKHSLMADVMIVIGSSLEVMPASNLPNTAKLVGAKIIINNFSPTSLDDQADVLLPYDAVDVLPEIVKIILE